MYAKNVSLIIGMYVALMITTTKTSNAAFSSTVITAGSFGSKTTALLPSKRVSLPSMIVNKETRVGTTTSMSISSEIRLSKTSNEQQKEPQKEIQKEPRKKRAKEKFFFASIATTKGPPLETKPDYENVFGPLGKLVDSLILSLFHNSLKKQVFGEDNENKSRVQENKQDSSIAHKASYESILLLADLMNQFYTNSTVIHEKAQKTLQALFPPFILNLYPILFSKPFPQFSARMNAWATYVFGIWLMGECEVNDIILESHNNSTDSIIGKGQGLLVKRCRFLEESGCASVCINSCKIPTQNFFMQDMKIPLLMEPNYETFECQFSFGKSPTVQTELDALSTPCLQRCPTSGSLRMKHSNSNKKQASFVTSRCYLIEKGDE